jgi:hypothetical protein
MTLLVRDEADIVDAQIAYHLSAGVDFVIATDNHSQDGTTEILEGYERAGVLRLLREPGDDLRQSEWVSHMARVAATEHGADWVINSDADEFWWPRGGGLKEVLAAVPGRYGVVRGAWRHFVPLPDDDRDFAERMIVRLRTPAGPGDKETIFHAHQKVAHRATSDVVVDNGNHNASGPGLDPLRGWYPLEILHFSFRSRAQFEQKAIRAFEGWTRNPTVDPTLHQVVAYEAVALGSADEYYDRMVVDDQRLERGLADGSLAIDTRVRDALSAVRRKDEVLFGAGGVEEAAAYVAELSPLIEIDGITRAERRVDALERRVERVERGVLSRLRGAGRVVDRRRLAPR